MKTFEISSDCHLKQVDLSNVVLFWKSLVQVFRRTYALSVGFEMKPLRKSVFKRQKQLRFYCRTCCKEQPFIFCLFSESPFSSICSPWNVTMERIELNWLSKHIKKVRGSQTSASINSYGELSRRFFLRVSLTRKCSRSKTRK